MLGHRACVALQELVEVWHILVEGGGHVGERGGLLLDICGEKNKRLSDGNMEKNSAETEA